MIRKIQFKLEILENSNVCELQISIFFYFNALLLILFISKFITLKIIKFWSCHVVI